MEGTSQHPRAAVLEILSPITRLFDRSDKPEEYKTVPTLEHVILVGPDYPQVRRYYREPDRTWASNRLKGLDAVLDLALFDMRLALSALYAGLASSPCAWRCGAVSLACPLSYCSSECRVASSDIGEWCCRRSPIVAYLARSWYDHNLWNLEQQGWSG